MTVWTQFVARVATLLISVYWTAAVTGAAVLYVAPTGSDSHNGAQATPFASPERAQHEVRALIANGLEEDIVIKISGGVYPLLSPLQFEASDVGAKGHKVIYQAAPGEKVVITGGRRIVGWDSIGDNQWTTTLPEVASGDWRFRQLFAEGERLPRARFPNAPDLLRVEGVSEEVTTITLDRESGIDSANQRVELVMFQNWSISRAAIVSADASALRLAYPMGWIGHGPATTASPGKPCYVENALPFVDAPGEWYLEETTGLLTYQAAPGEEPNAREFIAPWAQQLIIIAGESGAPVRNLHFQGIAFECTSWPLPDFGYMGIQAGHYGTRMEDPTHVLPGTIEWTYAEDCSLIDCSITRTGACGVVLGAGCRQNRIESCTLRDIGGNGIMIGWRGKGRVTGTVEGEDFFLSADWAHPEDIPIGNVIKGCAISQCGTVNHGCVGISDAFADGTQIVQNLISDMPYTGISIGFRWNTTATSQRNTLVAYNHVYDTMKMLADGGCLYTLGYQPGTVILGNVFHDAHRSGFAVGGAPNNGIFFDQGSSGMRIESNLIYNTSGEAVRFNQTDADQFSWTGNSFGVGPGRSESP